MSNCIDCNKEVSRNAKRCKSCSRKGKFNWNYKGKLLRKCTCCNKSIGVYPSYIKELGNFCSRKCASIVHGSRISKLSRGKNNPNYKDGKCIKENFPNCITCGKKLSSFNCKHCMKCFHVFCLSGKKRPLHSKRMKGELNPSYIHGLSFSKYSLDFNDQLKESIRKRDNYECKNCGMTEEEHIIINGSVLSIHHIDYEKNNNVEENLISLCKQCHARTNFNRQHWKNVFVVKEKNYEIGYSKNFV